MTIDNANFAINDRCYDPTAVGPYSVWKSLPSRYIAPVNPI